MSEILETLAGLSVLVFVIAEHGPERLTTRQIVEPLWWHGLTLISSTVKIGSWTLEKNTYVYWPTLFERVLIGMASDASLTERKICPCGAGPHHFSLCRHAMASRQYCGRVAGA